MSKVRVTQVAHHRNGVSGESFYAVLFSNEDREPMVGIVFERKGQCAVLRVPDLLNREDGVTFARNSWRGDHFEPLLREAIAKFEYDRDSTFMRKVSE